MSELLETKLFAPRWREGMVSRPRLVAELSRPLDRKLTVISAPAGFGKTTLIAEWIASSPEPDQTVAWVALDQSDNEPQSFWRYLLAALGRVDPDIGARARTLLESPEPPPIETTLTSTINDIARLGGEVTLVLDDFHVIQSTAILSGLAFLMQHMPPSMHLIIISRSDPSLPLARLRGSGTVIELRAADLRFTVEEATAFFRDAMGLDLAVEDVFALDARTEGWIAGLQLAALSLRGRQDASSFIQAFAGDDRFVVDYLVEEVLNRQPREVRAFLLRTSILDRMCASLCNALDDSGDGQKMLEALERDNVFLTPLDDNRRWYRYHHLFADVLRAHAVQEQPDQVAIWHRRASSWFETHHQRSDAIRHALEAHDVDLAAELIELAWRPMDRSRRGSTWLEWIRQLPDATIAPRPVLCVAYAWALLEEGELAAGERWLDTAGNHPNPPVVADTEELEYLDASIAGARAFRALSTRDVDSAADFARQALQLLPDDDHRRRSTPATLLALAAWTRGDLDEAASSLETSIESARALGELRYVVNGSYVLGEVLRGRGSIDAAKAVYDRALRSLSEQDEAPAGSTADIHTGMAELHLLRHELDAAQRELVKSQDLGETAGLPHWRHRWLVARAGLLEARGDLAGAIEALDEAAECYARSPVPEIRPIAAYRARVLIRDGRLEESGRYLAEIRRQPGTAPDYLQEYVYLTLARQIIARRRINESDEFRRELFQLLDRLLDAARTQNRVYSQIGILLLTALALDAFDSRSRAIPVLEEALELADPPGLIQPFLVEGPSMRDLLRAAVAEGLTGGLLPRLWPAFESGELAPPPERDRTASELVEPLTERELDVLRLIATGMRNREIADELYVSLSTVKRHIANAYGKLAVHSRTEAVARANELKLL